VFRPVAVAFDPRLEGLEHRIVERVDARLDEMETRVATDAEVIAEMGITQSRLLARLEVRLAELEARLGGDGGGGGVTVAALRALAELPAPARVAVSSPGDVSLAVALAGLGHDVVVLDAGAAVPSDARIRVGDLDGAQLDAAVVLGDVDAALVGQAAARLRPGGMLLVASGAGVTVLRAAGAR